MGDAFGNWFINHFPLLFWMTITAIATGFVMWQIFKFRNRFNVVESKVNPLEKSVSSLAYLSERIELKIDGNFLPKLDKTIDKLDATTQSLNKLIFYLDGKFDGMDSKIFVVNSPIQLSDTGYKILEITGGKEFVDKNLDYLIGNLEKQKYKTALDVETNSGLTIYGMSDLDSFTKIKNYIFNNPIYKTSEYEIGLSLNLVIQIMGIYLRDKYLDLHPKLKEV